MGQTSRVPRTTMSRLAGAGIAAVAGCILATLPVGESLVRRSYDWLFQFRPVPDLSQEPVVIVEMDTDSQDRLGESSVRAWRRERHAELMRILKTQQVDTVVFDVIFRNPGPELSAADRDLLRAAAEHGKVVFAAYQEQITTPDGRDSGRRIVRPFDGGSSLENVGLALQSFASDRMIRSHYVGDFNSPVEMPALPWRVAKLTMARPPSTPLGTFWLNYYGKSGTRIPRVSYWRIISGSTSLNLGRKIVFVGANMPVGPPGGTGTDIIPTPYGPMPGVEVNATAFLNLYRGDWLRRPPFAAELALLVLLGGLAGFFLQGWRPLSAVGLGALASAVVFIGAILATWYGHVWFPWLIVCAVQIPCAVGCSVLAHANLAQEGITPPQIQPLASVADHTLLRVIGRGGYGEVWLAVNVVGLYRAVKIVYQNRFDKPEPYEREFRGIQNYLPISLNHPGLVRVFHVGRNDIDGYFYSIMELADDEMSGQQINPETYQPRNLAREITQKGRIPGADCVRIFSALAEALDYLHQQHLIHRDIKPSNIILVGGAPKFADIGLVAPVATSSKTATYVGTEGYIAPEGPGTPAADVYSLGKVLYEACMGRDRELFPEFPTTWIERPDHALLVELNKILGKACMTDPNLRYASAAQMHTDLMRLQPKA